MPSVNKMNFKEFTKVNPPHQLSRTRLLPHEYYETVKSLEIGEHFYLSAKELGAVPIVKAAKALHNTGATVGFAIRTKTLGDELHVFRVA